MVNHRKIKWFLMLCATAALCTFSGLALAAAVRESATSKRGQRAIEALGGRLPAVAARYGKSAERLRELFLQNNDLWLDPAESLFYACGFELPEQGLPEQAMGMIPSESIVPFEDTFKLHSLPGSQRTIYLDFDGHVTKGTVWNSSFNSGADIVSAPFNFEGDTSSFTDAELDRIQYIWARVAEDFAAFDVDVTTEDPGTAALRRDSSSDSEYGLRMVISASSSWYPYAVSGVCYVGAFSWSSDTPGFVFPNRLGSGNEKYTAECISHESGHGLGLNHDGKTDGTEYYRGHGIWAPIMGNSYYGTLTQWSKGEYSGANNKEDDLAIIQSTGAPQMPDDHGGTNGTATPITLGSGGIDATGVTEKRTDVDVFSFPAGAGSISINIDPAEPAANLDISAHLQNSSGSIIATSGTSGLPAALNATVADGTYYLHVWGVGTGDPTTGYSDYASIGQYFISGTVAGTGVLGLDVSPTDAAQFSGPEGGTFSPAVARYTLSNKSASAISWTATENVNWLALTLTQGTISGSRQTTVDAYLTSNATSLSAGVYTTTISFTDSATSTVHKRDVRLDIYAAPPGGADFDVSPIELAKFSGSEGGPIEPSVAKYTLSNRGAAALTWSATEDIGWIWLSNTGGTIPAGGETTASAAVTSLGIKMPVGIYPEIITFTDLTNSVVHVRDLQLEITGVTTGADFDVSPTTDSEFAGQEGGPFSPSVARYTLSNNSSAELTWSATESAAWLALSPTQGTLSGGAAATIDAVLTTQAASLSAGSYTATITFSDSANTVTHNRQVRLEISAPPTGGEFDVAPAMIAEFSGPEGGPIDPSVAKYTLSNRGTAPLDWTATEEISWIWLSNTGGTIPPGDEIVLSAAVTSMGIKLAPGVYLETVTFTDTTNSVIQERQLRMEIFGDVEVPDFDVSPTGAAEFTGPEGGGFSPSVVKFTLSNNTSSSLGWSVTENVDWLDVSPAQGTIPGGGKTTVDAFVTGEADLLPAGVYTDTITFADSSNSFIYDIDVRLEVFIEQITYALATSDMPVEGVVTGVFADTHFDDGSYQTITEVSSGRKNSAYVSLEHKWTFSVEPSDPLIFHLNAERTGSGTDSFVFAYSKDNATYTDMISVSDAITTSYVLPSSLSGTIYVRVKDTDTSRGEGDLDSVQINEMYIESERIIIPDATPPAPPAGLYASGAYLRVDLDWNDNSDRDLDGYNVYRSTTGDYVDPPLNGAGLVSASYYQDTSAAAGVRYFYVVTAVDLSQRESTASNEATAVATNQLKTMHVEDIAMGVRRAGKNYAGKATVLIYTNTGAPLSGATVSGVWSGAVSGSVSGTTDSAGKIMFQSDNVKGGGTFYFTVSNVARSDYLYDDSANVEVSDSIKAP